MKILKFFMPAVIAVAMISCSGETTDAANDEATKTECSEGCEGDCDHKKDCDKDCEKDCDHKKKCNHEEGECTGSCDHEMKCEEGKCETGKCKGGEDGEEEMSEHEGDMMEETK